jgi:hypothetical protein
MSGACREHVGNNLEVREKSGRSQDLGIILFGDQERVRESEREIKRLGKLDFRMVLILE